MGNREHTWASTTINPGTTTSTPRGWQVRSRPNVFRCDTNRSPCSMCSQTACAHRHGPQATFHCTSFRSGTVPRCQTSAFSQKTIHDPHVNVFLLHVQGKRPTRTRCIDSWNRFGVSVCHPVRLDLVNRFRDPAVPESGGGRLARRSSDGRRSAISQLERSLFYCRGSGSGHLEGGPPRSLNSCCFSTRIDSSACNRKANLCFSQGRCGTRARLPRPLVERFRSTN